MMSIISIAFSLVLWTFDSFTLHSFGIFFFLQTLGAICSMTLKKDGLMDSFND